jgi:hypothetical protein
MGEDEELVIRGAEATRGLSSAPITLVVCGDPIVGRALVLLLQSSDYDARFLSVPSLGQEGSLETHRLLLLTPEADAKRREARMAALNAAGAAEIPTLELTDVTYDGQVGASRAWSERAVPWPCSTEELKQRVETAIYGKCGADRTDPEGTFSATALGP